MADCQAASTGQRKKRNRRGKRLSKRKAGADGGGEESPTKKKRVPKGRERDTTTQRHHRIREAKGVDAKDVAIDVRTVTASMDKLIKKTSPMLEKKVAERIEKRSVGAGYLMPIHAQFMNHVLGVSIPADQPVPDYSNTLPEHQLPHDGKLLEEMTEKNFHRKVMRYLAGHTNLQLHGPFRNFLLTYMEQHPISPHAQAMISCLDGMNFTYMNNEWFTSFKNNIILNYKTRFVRMFYDYFRPGMNGDIKKRDVWNIAKKAYELCNENRYRAAAAHKLYVFCREFEWFYVNDVVSSEGGGSIEDDGNENVSDVEMDNSSVSNGSSDFESSEHDTDEPRDDESLPSEGGNDDFDNLALNQWPRNSEAQSATTSPENSEYYRDIIDAAVELFHEVSFESILDEADEPTDTEKLRYYLHRMKKVRSLSSAATIAGYRPRLFRLAPKCQWKRRFIGINTTNAYTVLNEALKELGEYKRGEGAGISETIKGLSVIFDFYGSSGNHWTEGRRPPQNSDTQKKNRRNDKVLLKGRCKRRGLPHMRKDEWATKLQLTDAEAGDPTKRFPFLVNYVLSNGIENKVLQSKMVFKEVRCGQSGNPLRPKGTWNLDGAGFRQLNEECDIREDKTGIFGKVKMYDPLPANMRAYGIDPGQKDLVSVVAEDMTLVDDAFELAENPRTSSVEVSSTRHARNILRTNANKKELHRRNIDPVYHNAIKELGEGSGRDPETCQSYLGKFYETMDTMTDRLVEQDRRKEQFARNRANQREFARIGKKITYHREQRTLRRLKLSRKQYRQMKKQLETALKIMLKVIGYGIPTWGNGIYGPCPRKKLIRCAARHNNVVMLDEYRTTKMCHVCGFETAPHGYRMRKCLNPLCGIITPRDTNGSMNLGITIVSEIRRGYRPQHLTRE